MTVAEVLVLRGVDQLYSYSIPEDLTVNPGDPVLIPFGRSKARGVVMALVQESESVFQLKPIIERDGARYPLTPNQSYSLSWLETECLCSSYQAYQAIIGSRKIRSEKNKKLNENSERESPLPLTDQQSAVLSQLLSSSDPALLHGVTGSGKTEIYMQMADHVVKEGKQALVMVPEISLTPQFYRQFNARFGDQVVVLHSGLTPKQRDVAWSKVVNQEISLVVGPRSSIFSPFQNLGLVVIDEAHDGAYKQDRHPRYDTIRLAESLCRHLRIPLVLGTATPLIEQVAQYQTKGHQYLRLMDRIGGRSLPTVQIHSLNEGPLLGPFSKPLLDAIQSRLNRGEKSMMMINRRGYAPYIICQACQKPLTCPTCDLGMTYHTDRMFRCHRCDISQVMTHTCPHCKKERLAFTGQGTQRIEVELKRHFPEARIVRLDRDTAKSAKKMASLLDSFRKEGDILVGTQLIAKGHHIESVTLVGVLGLDVSLNMPDFRAAENTFQLLTQVAGRAGRGDVPGEVWVQTRFHTHYAIQAAASHDYDTFYEKECAFRMALGYPPESRLIHIIAKASTVKQVKNYLITWHKRFSTLIQDMREVEFLGPKPAPFEQLRGEYRWHCLIKCFDDSYPIVLSKIRELNTIIATDKQMMNSKVQLGIDCDPRVIL